MESIEFYIAAVAAVLLIGISKSGFGGGLGVLAVPILSLVIPPIQAAAVLLPLLIVMDFITVRHYYRDWDARNLAVLLPAAVVGILAGSLFFRYLSQAHVRLMIGTMAIAFAVYYFFRLHSAPQKPASVAQGFFWGTLAGFTSFGAHAGGPPIDIYLLPQKLPKSRFVGTTVVFFMLVNIIKLIPYAMLGQLSIVNLKAAALLAPLAPVGVRFGLLLHRKVDEKRFYQLCSFFLLVTGVKLVADGLAAL
ncbi:MAG: sulfite exporter TauE/SafE family protein [candidate division KSB1 bacterium]|nr:sulfite exporter TauE/SafE family protein [candidate division KSB1 bacterium]